MKLGKMRGLERMIASLLLALGLSSPVLAQEAEDPVRSLGKALKFAATPPDAPDFVKNSRKPSDQMQFVPMAGPRPEPTRPVMSLQEIRAKEAELNALRSRHDAILGRMGPTQTYNSVGRERVVAAKPEEPKCLITCAISTTITNRVNSNVASPTKAE